MKIKRQSLIAIGIYTAVLLSIFAPALFTGNILFSLDSAPFYVKNYQQLLGDSFNGIWNTTGLGSPYQTFFHPHRLFAWLMPSGTYHNFSYLFDTALLALAMVFFLRGRNITGWAALAAALGLSFSGYTFTLISAGHRVTFDMMPYAVFTLAFVDRGVRSGHWYQLAMAGLCAGIGMSSGSPDKMILFGVLAGVYGLVLIIRERPSEQAGKHFAKLGRGLGLAAVLFAAMSAGTYTYLFSQGEVVERRDKMRGDTPEQKWAYATNWSLPPSDALEFIAPCVYGVESTSPEQIGARKQKKPFVPYWGKLGMPQGWEAEFNRIKGLANNPNATPKQKNQINATLRQMAGRLNYRQHTVYLGVIPISFAFFALLYFLGPANWSNRDDETTKRWRWFAIFWLVALILCILFSFGRYTPLYKIIYNLPVVNRIRAPVKFLHLAEVCLNILFALGLMTWIQLLLRRNEEKSSDDGQKVLMISGIVCAGMGVIMLVCLMIYGSTTGPLTDYWRSIMRGAYVNTFADQMAGAFGHACLVFLASAAMFLIPWKMRKPWTGTILPILVIVVLALDLISVNRQFIRTKDMKSWFGQNEVAEHIIQQGHHQRVSYQLGAPQKQDWHWFTFHHHRVALLEQPANIRPPARQQALSQALGQNALRRWQLNNAALVLASPQLAAQLKPLPSFEVECHFHELNGRYKFTENTQNTFALFRYKDALPKAQLFYQWEALDEAATLKRAASPGWNPKKSVLVPTDISAVAGGSGTDSVEISTYESDRIELTANAKSEAVLLLNDAAHPYWRATIDGQPADIFAANHVMRGVRIPAGKHNVHFEYQRPKATLNGFRVSFGVFLIMMGVSLFQGLRKLKNPAAASVSEV